MVQHDEADVPLPRATAVWSLFLPAAEHVVCHASDVPDIARELAARGVQVDLVSRCALESWNRRPLPGRSRCLWEPDPDADYDLALAWDPPTSAALRDWAASLATHPAPPREVAVWSRNPLHRSGVPPWWQIDAELERRGWEPGDAWVGLPATERVRQVVAWDAWTRTPLVRHRRTHRAWKEWMTRTPLGRWTQPARLRRAHLTSVTPGLSALQTILDAAGAAIEAPLAVERFLVSPNGVAIAIVTLFRAAAPRRAVLKIAYAVAAEPRLARNASALEWCENGGTNSAPTPRLLVRAQTAGWVWSLEEWVAGSDAQGWNARERERVLDWLGDVLAAWAASATPARALDDASFERLCGAAIRAAAALSPPDTARRLQALRERLATTLAEIELPLVPRHGDLKLENVLGDPETPPSWRVLDWELWTLRGLPLLDALHVVVSRRARDAGCAMGTAVRRWLLGGALDEAETRFLDRAAGGLDPRFVAVAPILYWLDRMGPIAERGSWPDPGWAQHNVTAVLDALPATRAAEVLA